MRCPYCFQALPERSRNCPRCGSNIPPEALVDAGVGAGAAHEAGKQPHGFWAARRHTTLLAVGAVLLICTCLSLVAVAGARSRFSPLVWFDPTPSPAPIRFRHQAFATATSVPIPMRSVCSRPAFCIRLPETWVVVDQGSPFWQREVNELGGEYPWAPALLGADPTTHARRIRAVPPDHVDLNAGRVARFSIGQTEIFGGAPEFEQIRALAQEQPALLAQALDGLVGTEIQSLRLSEREVAGLPATVVAYDSQLALGGGQRPVRVHLFFIATGEDLLLASTIMDQATFAAEPALFESVIQSIEPQ